MNLYRVKKRGLLYASTEGWRMTNETSKNVRCTFVIALLFESRFPSTKSTVLKIVTTVS